MTMAAQPMIKNKKAVRFRHEMKHIVNSQEALILSSRLKYLFKHDAHADSHGVYRVSSLYFDTPSDMALRQKLEGVDHREKFRIRYYNDVLSFIRLEKKFKVNGLCGKYHARLSKEQVEQILCGDIAFLLSSENALLIEFYSKLQGQLLKPKTIVTYEREAFLYEPGNVRVTLDQNLRSGQQVMAFLDPQLVHLPVHDGLSILEVKYDAFLPEIVRLAVQIENRQTSAYSKYAICRQYD